MPSSRHARPGSDSRSRDGLGPGWNAHRETRDTDPGSGAACDCDLEQHAALAGSALQAAGLSATFTKPYLEHIVNGELEEARIFVDREIGNARALLDAIGEFERSLDGD